VEFVALDFDLIELLIGYFDSGSVGLRVQFRMDLEAGSGAGNEVYDRFETPQRFSAPVLAAIGEQPVLDFVSLAGTWRKVADEDP
jgi:hypothetical protein